MDKHREVELLMQVAAGTDLPTAIAALPREDDRQPTAQSESSFASICIAMLTVVILLALALIRLFK